MKILSDLFNLATFKVPTPVINVPKKTVKPLQENPPIEAPILNTSRARVPLTEKLIWEIFPLKYKPVKARNVNAFVYVYNKYANYFDIDTVEEVSHFLSQLGHESHQFNAFEEYASGAAYEGRKDLGNIYPGDGRKFKGAGPIQTTGRNNYKQVGRELLKLPFLTDSEKKLFENDNILNRPELLRDPVWGTLAAFIYWQTRNINQYAKCKACQVTMSRLSRSRGWYKYTKDSVEIVTRVINGGTNGLSERRHFYDLVYNKLSK